MSDNKPRAKFKWDLWMIVTVAVSIFYLLFLLYPLFSMLSKSVIAEEGGLTWEFFTKVFTKKYYKRAIMGSIKISATVTLITVLLATPLAYIMSTMKIKFAGVLQILILVSSMSAPFIGAYAWIMLFGRNGTITNFLFNTFGLKIGDIYGFSGCVIVMSLQLYSLVYMFVSGAFKNMDNSLIEACESL
ncbi:MAG: iron ABC transporter permease, partial [Kiritimatiellae bacterium]|nr:iron ABC transporter permease [Kiritimatiellia bacterium]